MSEKKSIPTPGAEPEHGPLCEYLLCDHPGGREACPYGQRCADTPPQPSGERCGTCDWSYPCGTNVLHCHKVDGATAASNPACEHFRRSAESAPVCDDPDCMMRDEADRRINPCPACTPSADADRGEGVVTIHEVKCWHMYFRHLWDGTKRFEVRKNDRDYKTGDTIINREWGGEHNDYTGRMIEHRIGYVARLNAIGFDGYVAMQLEEEIGRQPLPCKPSESAEGVSSGTRDGNWIKLTKSGSDTAGGNDAGTEKPAADDGDHEHADGGVGVVSVRANEVTPDPVCGVCGGDEVIMTNEDMTRISKPCPACTPSADADRGEGVVKDPKRCGLCVGWTKSPCEGGEHFPDAYKYACEHYEARSPCQPSESAEGRVCVNYQDEEHKADDGTWCGPNPCHCIADSNDAHEEGRCPGYSSDAECGVECDTCWIAASSDGKCSEWREPGTASEGESSGEIDLKPGEWCGNYDSHECTEDAGCGPGLVCYKHQGRFLSCDNGSISEEEYIAARLAPREDMTPVTAADLDSVHKDAQYRNSLVTKRIDALERQIRDHADGRECELCVSRLTALERAQERTAGKVRRLAGICGFADSVAALARELHDSEGKFNSVVAAKLFRVGAWPADLDAKITQDDIDAARALAEERRRRAMADRLTDDEERELRTMPRSTPEYLRPTETRIWATLDAVRSDLAAEQEARGRAEAALHRMADESASYMKALGDPVGQEYNFYQGQHCAANEILEALALEER